MSRLIFSRAAVRDLLRLRDFIAEKSPQAATRISQRLHVSLQHLAEHPELGYPVDEALSIREFITGDYTTHYHYRDDDNTVTILRIWHGKEDH